MTITESANRHYHIATIRNLLMQQGQELRLAACEASELYRSGYRAICGEIVKPEIICTVV